MLVAVLPMAVGWLWAATCLAVVEVLEVQEIQRGLTLFGNPNMPSEGDKRLIQVTATTGQEVMLLKRSGEPG